MDFASIFESPSPAKGQGLKRPVQADDDATPAAKRVGSQLSSDFLQAGHSADDDGDEGSMGPSTWVKRVITSFTTAARLNPSELPPVTVVTLCSGIGTPTAGLKAVVR